MIMPKKAQAHIQNTAPGPPTAIAVATPPIAVHPTEPPIAIQTASIGDIVPSCLEFLLRFPFKNAKDCTV